MDELPAGVAARRDYNEEGRKLLKTLGATPNSGRHKDLDVIWSHPNSGGKIFVGNETAAAGPVATLKARGIRHVVNCTDDMPNFCEPDLMYMRFNVAYWQSAGAPAAEKPCSTAEKLSFIWSLFDFVQAATDKGESVLVHCLAGAHRAGTTGCLLLMRKGGLSAAEAIAAAKAARPCINPIGSLPGLLAFYESAREAAGGDVP